MIITYDNVKTNIDFVVDDYFRLISNFNKYCLSGHTLNNLNIWYDVDKMTKAEKIKITNAIVNDERY
tara:strand:- start:240 stop:440 length:201 start_codon:yes stop_codon:yes gene_type:complete